MKKMSPSLRKVVNLLNQLEFQDGTSMGEKLSMSRTAIWKIIKKLTAYGVNIQSVKGKGYTLMTPLILLDKQKIKKGLINKKISVELFETIDSTNNYLKTEFSPSMIKICLSEAQTQGRGRLQRTWHSPFGENIYLSLAYPFSKEVSELGGLSLIIGLSLCKTLNECYDFSTPFAVKWPNDILYQGQKLGGNLIEIQAETHGYCHAIIGIGLNINMVQSHTETINQPWISIKKINGVNNDRNNICIRLINDLMLYLERFETLGLAGFLDEWMLHDYLARKTIQLKSGNNEFTGVMRGIDQRGHLLLTLKDGNTLPFSAGDTKIMMND